MIVRDCPVLHFQRSPECDRSTLMKRRTGELTAGYVCCNLCSIHVGQSSHLLQVFFGCKLLYNCAADDKALRGPPATDKPFAYLILLL